ncbi:MAG: hypothetical protein V3T05_07115 [Myxococcota bacterium]
MRRIALLCLVPLLGCGGPDEDPLCQTPYDEATTTEVTAYEEVADETWEARPIDFANCVADPAPTGADCTLPVQVIDFKESAFKTELGGTTVKVFLNNTVADLNATCESHDSTVSGAVCYEGHVEDNGQLEFLTIPCNTRVVVWANKTSSSILVTKAAIEFHHWVDDGMSTLKVQTISAATYGLIPGILGFAPNTELGIVAGKARDCADNSIANVHTHIAPGHADEPPTSDFCGDDPIYGVGTFYFVNSLPSKGQMTTSEDGIWSFANVPPGPVTIFAQGRRADGGAVVPEIGKAKVWAFADTITISDLNIQAP